MCTVQVSWVRFGVFLLGILAFLHSLDFQLGGLAVSTVEGGFEKVNYLSSRPVKVGHDDSRTAGDAGCRRSYLFMR
jgi:hypothetical protein